MRWDSRDALLFPYPTPDFATIRNLIAISLRIPGRSQEARPVGQVWISLDRLLMISSAKWPVTAIRPLLPKRC